MWFFSGYYLGFSKHWAQVLAWLFTGSGTLDKSLDFECVLEELQTLRAL